MQNQVCVEQYYCFSQICLLCPVRITHSNMIPDTGWRLNVKSQFCKYFSIISWFHTCEVNVPTCIMWNGLKDLFSSVLFRLIMRKDVEVRGLKPTQSRQEVLYFFFSPQ